MKSSANRLTLILSLYWLILSFMISKIINKNLLFYFILVLFLLTACTTSPSATPTATQNSQEAEPSPTATVLVEEEVPSPTSTTPSEQEVEEQASPTVATESEQTEDTSSEEQTQQTEDTSGTEDAQQTEDAPATEETESVESYPPPSPVAQNEAESYPIVTATPDASYPAPEPTKRPAVVILDEPVSATDQMVSGTGLPNLPVKVISISRNGDQLGQGTIGEDGTFTIEVSQLEQGTLVGIIVDDLSSSDYTEEDLHNCEGCRDMPLLGTILASAVVQ